MTSEIKYGGSRAAHCERGATMIEYSMLASCIAIVAIASIGFLGENMMYSFYYAGETLDHPIAGAVEGPLP